MCCSPPVEPHRTSACLGPIPLSFHSVLQLSIEVSRPWAFLGTRHRAFLLETESLPGEKGLVVQMVFTKPGSTDFRDQANVRKWRKEEEVPSRPQPRCPTPKEHRGLAGECWSATGVLRCFWYFGVGMGVVGDINGSGQSALWPGRLACGIVPARTLLGL